VHNYGWPLVNHLYPEDRERIIDEIHNRISGFGPIKLEYRVLAKWGGIVWLRDESSLVYDKEGNPLFIQGLLQDITEQKRTSQEIKSYINQVESLLDIDKAFSSSLNLDEIIHILITEVTKNIKCDSITIQFPDSEMSSVDMNVYNGDGTFKYHQKSKQDSEIPTFEAINARQTLLIDDLAEVYPQFYKTLLEINKPIHSWAGIPLICNEKIIGAVTLGRLFKDPFDKSEIETVSAISSHAALAIENARLFGEANTRFDRINSLHQFELVVSSNKDLQSILNKLLDQVSIIYMLMLRIYFSLIPNRTCSSIDRAWFLQQ
jgi:transcriptional regulator with GAF, ATPase, and Fis domain